jgi:ribosomal protein L27
MGKKQIVEGENILHQTDLFAILNGKVEYTKQQQRTQQKIITTTNNEQKILCSRQCKAES